MSRMHQLAGRPPRPASHAGAGSWLDITNGGRVERHEGSWHRAGFDTKAITGYTFHVSDTPCPAGKIPVHPARQAGSQAGSNTQTTHHHTDLAVPPELLETLAGALAAALIPAPRLPEPTEIEDTADFLTAAQLAQRLGVSRETVRRLAIAGTLPHTVVCRGARKTTRRFPRRFAEEFAAGGLEAADLATAVAEVSSACAFTLG